VTQLVLSAVVIIVTMVTLEWLEATRARLARARRQRREQLDRRPAVHLPEHTEALRQRRTAVRLSLALGLALLPATAAWGQNLDESANRWFRVSWVPGTNRVLRTIEGHVYNDSPNRVTAVRLQVEGLDADSHLVGQALVWALGDVVPGGKASFVVETIRGAVTYRIAVVSFDVVSVGQAP
jgi:hypothetical protein